MSIQNKWGRPPNSKVVAYYHRRVAEIVEEKFTQSGKSWQEFVWNDEFALSERDFQSIEDELLATGVRFEMSAQISIDEAPEKYQLPAADETLDDVAPDQLGRRLAGGGDNVFQAEKDILGTARFIGNVDAVMDYLTNGVPANTVAIIDDSGGTLTAPILENFAAVVCKGGSVRSHLGILTREYQIPCLMNAEVRGLKEGDEVQVEYSVPAKTPYEEDATGRARVWKLP
ncbi:MAG: PEP-utilizing enzyme [Gammaproteobacteria bacterium]